MTRHDVFELLREWAERYVRFRDISKSIAGIRNAGFGFEIIGADGAISECYVLPSLAGIGEDVVKRAGIVVALSNEVNIRVVCRMWPLFSANAGLLLIFANPFSSSEEKWLLKPHLHDRVSDKGSLLQGLKAMAELVEPVSEDEFEAIAGQQQVA